MSERARGKGRSGPVTAAAVVDAALVVIDEDGLDALTMRRLAHDLGVEPVTIYRQLPNKDAILAGVAEKLWREMAPREAGGDVAAPSPATGTEDWREQVRGMWLALNGLISGTPTRSRSSLAGTYSPSAEDGTAGMLRVFKDAGLSPADAAELLHILSACVVGFGFATVWGRQMAAAREAAAAEGAAQPQPPAAGAATHAAPADDLADYLEATAKWDPAQFATAVDIVLGAYGDRDGA